MLLVDGDDYVYVDDDDYDDEYDMSTGCGSGLLQGHCSLMSPLWALPLSLLSYCCPMETVMTMKTPLF